MKSQVLDHGFVELVDVLGSELTIVNSARVSFGKRKTELDDKDIKLIKYLAKHKHWSPFRHVQLQFHCKVPEFIARQWYKHVVGMAYTEASPGLREIDHAWNELSLRYTDASNIDFYCPSEFRKQSESNKQCSTEEITNPKIYDSTQCPNVLNNPSSEVVQNFTELSRNLYRKLIEAGIAKEQARMVLPLNFYTEFYWTVSLQGLVNFLHLRLHEGAQYEIRLYAEALANLVLQKFPNAVGALLNRNKLEFTQEELKEILGAVDFTQNNLMATDSNNAIIEKIESYLNNE